MTTGDDGTHVILDLIQNSLIRNLVILDLIQNPLIIGNSSIEE